MVRVSVATAEGVVRLDPDRETTSDPALPDHTVECVATVDDQLLVGTFDDGLWRTTDGSLASLERVARFDGAAVTALSVAPDDTTVWAGTEPSRVYRSTDAGETWASLAPLATLPSADEWSFPPRPHTHHVRWLEPAPAAPDRWYVAVEAGALVRTADGGESWRDRTADGPRDSHTITTHRDRPAAAWVAAGDGYAETTDRGDSWRFPTDGLDHRYCWSVATPPEDPDTVVVSAARSAREAHTAARAETYCYRRDRTAGTWERLTDRGLPLGEGVTRPVVARGSQPGELYAASNRGCFRTTDAGDSWHPVGGDWPDRFADTTVSGLCVA